MYDDVSYTEPFQDDVVALTTAHDEKLVQYYPSKGQIQDWQSQKSLWRIKDERRQTSHRLI